MFPQDYYSSLYSLVFSYLSLNSTLSGVPVVDLGYARYQGIVDPNSSYLNYLGIQYAHPPTEELRFSAPAPPPFVEDVQVADRQPPRCIPGNLATAPNHFVRFGPLRSPTPQRTGVGSFSEDCLYLNVYTPNPDPEAKLPVVVWIHGGAYSIGGATGIFGDRPYDGNDLVRQSGEGVVAVVLQSRLGILGFLAGEAVKDEGALNAGLLDQQYALKWIQEHIHKFGGDASKVTIWGQSAGAGSSVFQNIANDGRTDPPLFRGVMLNSFYEPNPTYKYNDPVPKAMFQNALEHTNCSSSSNPLDCLRNLPVEDLEAANYYIGVSGKFGDFNFKPVIDGSFITQRPGDAFKSGKLNTNYILASTDINEGEIFVDPEVEKTLSTAEIIKQLFPDINEAHLREAVALYPSGELGLYQSVGVKILSEATFVCPTYHLLKHLPGTGYTSTFAISPGLHGMELDYFFTSTNPSGFPVIRYNTNNSSFQKAFGNAFLDFAMNLDPNVKREDTVMPKWNAWTVDDKQEMLFGIRGNEFDDVGDGQPVIELVRTDEGLYTRCRFWESIGE